MLIYNIVFFLFAAFSFLDITNIKKRKKESLALLLGGIIILLSALRWETGTDWDSYYYYFLYNNTFNDFLSGGFEPGFSLINYLVKNIFNDYTFLLFFTIFPIVILKYECMLRYSLFPFMSICLNASNYLGDLFPVRQYLALAIVFYSVKYIIEKRRPNFIFAVLLAASIHFTAIIFLPAYYVFYLNISKKNLLLLSVFSLFVGLSGVLEKLILDLIGLVWSNNIVIVKVKEYLDAKYMGNEFGYAISSFAGIFFGILRRSVFLPFIIYFKGKIEKYDVNYRGFLNLTITGFCIYFLLSQFGLSVAGRMSLYYTAFEVFVIPCLFFVFLKKQHRIILFALFFLFCFMKFYFGLYGFYDLFVPYKTILNNM